MRVTRRYWVLAGFGVALAVSAVVTARSMLLVGTAGIGAWLLARQYAFVRALARTTDDVEIAHELARPRAPIDDPVAVSLSPALSFPSPLALRIEARPPPVARDVGETVTWLPVGERESEGSFEISVPVAGAFRFESPRVTAIDPHGLFVQSFPRGPTPEITVEPRGPREVHVGAGGERVASAYGEHDTGRHGSGLDPAELREYVAGDTARRIDWKTTARRGAPYVREYEVEADYTTLVLFDRREHMGTGSVGETKLDYARHVALAFVESAREFNDPLGLAVAGDEGVLDQRPPAIGAGQYAAVRDRLRALRSEESSRIAGTASNARSPADARRRATLLSGDESAFGSVIKTFFASADAYIERIAGDPLFETARRSLAGTRGATRTVIFTNDTNRAELKETIKLARRGDDRVLVFCAPSVLFEESSLTDLDSAYERYVEFEEFRRELARTERVSAFEIAPGDRLDAVLAAGTDRRRQRA